MWAHSVYGVIFQFAWTWARHLSCQDLRKIYVAARDSAIARAINNLVFIWQDIDMV